MEKLSFKTKVDYGAGTVGKSLSYMLSSGHFLYYCVNVLRLDKAFLMPLFFVVRIWDGLTDLLMGTVIDNTRSRLGKFRPWILLGAVSNALVVVGMFWFPGLRGAGLMIYITVFFLLFDLTYTMVDVGYWSMIPALTLDTHERDQISIAPRVIGGIAGSISAFFFQIINMLGGEEVNRGFFRYALITSFFFILTAVYSGITVKERVAAPPQTQAQRKYSLAQAFRILVNNKQALVVIVIMVLFNLANNLTNDTMIYYFKFVLGEGHTVNILNRMTLNNLDQYSYFRLIIGGAQFIGIACFSMFSKRFGRNRLYISSMITPIAGYLLMSLSSSIAPGAFLPFLLAGFISNSGYGLMSVMQSVMLADAVDHGEYETGSRNEGIIFSALTFLTKIASAFSSVIILFGFSIAKFGGEDAVNATPGAQSAIRFLMFQLPPICLVLTLIVYLSGFRLKPRYMQTVTEELRHRREASTALS